MDKSNEGQESMRLSDQEIDQKYLQGMNNRFKEYTKEKIPLLIGLSFLNIILTPFDLLFVFGVTFSIGIHLYYIFTFRRRIIIPFRVKFSLQRKMISTWTNRLIYFSILFLLQLMRPIPFVSALAPIGGIVLIVSNTYGAFWYYRWHFQREIENKGLLLLEKLFLIAVLFTFLFSTLVIVISLFIFGTIIECGVDPNCSIIREIGKALETIL